MEGLSDGPVEVAAVAPFGMFREIEAELMFRSWPRTEEVKLGAVVKPACPGHGRVDVGPDGPSENLGVVAVELLPQT